MISADNVDVNHQAGYFNVNASDGISYKFVLHVPTTDSRTPFSDSAVQSFPRGSISAILTDIEGTTTAISFVQDVLFPYAKKNVGQYLLDHEQDPLITQVIEEVKLIAGTPQADLDQVIAILLSWMEQDKKITPLKTLQGLMWEEGYKRQAFQGHVYEDAFFQLQQWKEQGIPLYVYSSGSVKAQQLLFAHSNFGDITSLFSAYFDTKIGSKKESSSYLSIAQKIGSPPEAILFLSDSIDEIEAAQAIGMQVLLLCREDGCAPNACSYSFVNAFDRIKIEELLLQ